MVVLKQPFHFWWSEQWRKVSQILAVYFSTGVWCFFLRALKSLGKPCLKLENGESKSLRDLCGRFFLAGTGKNQAHHDSWDLLKLKPKKSASRVGNAWREHATWARILKKGNVYGMAICLLWVRPVVLRILDFKKQQVGSSYSFSSIQFHRFHSLRGSKTFHSWFRYEWPWPSRLLDDVLNPEKRLASALLANIFGSIDQSIWGWVAGSQLRDDWFFSP